MEKNRKILFWDMKYNIYMYGSYMYGTYKCNGYIKTHAHTAHT